MVIITGPGRSGTSMLALFCERMGYSPGGNWCDEVNAGLENEQVVAINDALFKELYDTGSAEVTLRRHSSEIQALTSAVVKDPRFTFDARVLNAWCSVRTDLKVLLTYRNPEHCFASRKRNRRYLMHKHGMEPDTFRYNLVECIDTLQTSDVPFRLLLFPYFLDQFDRVYGYLQELGLKMQFADAERVWRETVNMDKVHFHPKTNPPAAPSTRRPMLQSLAQSAVVIVSRAIARNE